MTEARDRGNGNGEVLSLPARSPEALYLTLQRMAEGQLELSERQGHMMRELVGVREDVREIKADVADLKRDQHEARRKLESIPEIVEGVAERTGQHQIAELRADLAREDAQEAKGKLAKADDRKWAIIAPILVGAVMAVLGMLLGHLAWR